jgi:hypothetical protein
VVEVPGGMAELCGSIDRSEGCGWEGPTNGRQSSLRVSRTPMRMSRGGVVILIWEEELT